MPRLPILTRRSSAKTTRGKGGHRNAQTNRRRMRRNLLAGLESLEARQLLAADVLLAESFEGGGSSNDWGGAWVEDSQDDWFRSTQRSSDGSRSAEVDGRATGASLSLSQPVDLSGYESAELTFDWFIESSFDNGEYLALELFDSSSWQQVRRIDGTSGWWPGPDEHYWHSETVVIDSSYLNTDFNLRFVANVSSSSEDGFVDNVRVTGNNPSGPPELISHWAGDGNSLDSQGRNNGLAFNGASYSTGQVGSSFVFDGINDGIDVTDSASLALTESITIEAWVRMDSIPENQHGLILFRGDDRGGLDPYQLRVNSNGLLQFLITDDSNATASVAYEMPQGQSTHVAATLDNASGEMRLYLNSVLVASTTTDIRPFGALDPASNPSVGIGNHGGYTGGTPHNFPFHGAIDELKLYNIPLAQADIETSFLETKGSLAPYLTISDASATEGDIKFNYADDLVSPGLGGLSDPRGITFGPDGNLYVSSAQTDSILRYDSTTGAFIDEFVSSGSGGLDFPNELAFRDGFLYVVSSLSDSVLRYDASNGAFVDEFVSSGSGGLVGPRGLLFGSNNDLYVSSAGTGDAVLRYDATTGAFIDEFISFQSNGLDNPSGMTIGLDGNFYVTSTFSGNSAILRFSPDGTYIDDFVPHASGGLDGPIDILFDESDGLVYVSGVRSTVHSYDISTGEFIRNLGTDGSGINSPLGMLFSSSGDLVVADRFTSSVNRFSKSSPATFNVGLSTVWNEPVTVDYATADGSALAGSDFIAQTGSVTFSPGEIEKAVSVPIIDDSEVESDETFQINLSNAVGATILDGSGVGTIIDTDFPPPQISVNDADVVEGDQSAHYRGAFIQGTPGGHFNPLTFGPDGFVYTAVGTGPGYNTVEKFDSTTGEFVETFIDNSDPDHQINGIRDIVFHPTDGMVYVASAYTNEVLRYDAATGDFVDVFVSVGAGGIEHPDGMMFGPDANNDGNPELYVTGWLSNNIIRYDGVTGLPLGNFVTAGSGGLSFPFAMALHNDELFVTSAGTNEILKFDAFSGNFISVVTDEGLDYPRGLTFGSDDLLYVTSGNDDRIIRYTAQGAYVDDFVPAGTNGLDDPRTPRFGPDGDLYVTVTGKDEIMRFGTANEAVFTVSLSTPSSEQVTVDVVANSGTATSAADFLSVSETVVFSPGVTVRTVTVPVLDDAVLEPIELFTLDLSNALSAVIADSQGIGTIIDNEVPNQPPVVDAGADQTVTEGNSVTLVGSASDSDGTIESVEWSDGVAVLSTTSSLTTTLPIGTHTLTFSATDDSGATSSDSVVVTVEAAAAGPNLSHGELNSVSSVWQTVTLSKSYTSPVIVTTPRYNAGSGPGVVRIHNVTASSFDVRIDNVGSTAFSGGLHYVVVEEGVYDEPGFKLEAVKYSESQTSRRSGWQIDTSQGYQQSYSNPVVVGQVMSTNDSDWSVFWASSNSRTSPPSSSQLNVGKHVAEDPDTTRATETIGYLVIEATQNGTIEGLPFVAGVGSDIVRGVGNGTDQYGYTAMPNAKTAILSSAGMDGNDGGWAVLRGSEPLPPSGGTIALSIDEDQLRDSERNHTTEQVAYFVIDPPVVAAESEQMGAPAITTRPLDIAGTSQFDVNGDGMTSPIDALLVINRLNTIAENLEEGDLALDLNGDESITPLDALLVINRLNASDNRGVFEAVERKANSDSASADVDLSHLAVDAYFEEFASGGRDRKVLSS